VTLSRCGSMSVGGVERRTCPDEKSDTVDNKEDVCQQVAGGSLPPTESHRFVLQLLCAHSHHVPVFCSDRQEVMSIDLWIRVLHASVVLYLRQKEHLY
jgi:hypothetical protein